MDNYDANLWGKTDIRDNIKYRKRNTDSLLSAHELCVKSLNKVRSLLSKKRRNGRVTVRIADINQLLHNTLYVSHYANQLARMTQGQIKDTERAIKLWGKRRRRKKNSNVLDATRKLRKIQL